MYEKTPTTLSSASPHSSEMVKQNTYPMLLQFTTNREIQFQGSCFKDGDISTLNFNPLDVKRQNGNIPANSATH